MAALAPNAWEIANWAIPIVSKSVGLCFPPLNGAPRRRAGPAPCAMVATPIRSAQPFPPRTSTSLATLLYITRPAATDTSGIGREAEILCSIRTLPVVTRFDPLPRDFGAMRHEALPAADAQIGLYPVTSRRRRRSARRPACTTARDPTASSRTSPMRGCSRSPSPGRRPSRRRSTASPGLR